MYSTFGVVTIDRAGRGVPEDGLGQRGQPRLVDVLDDLHQHRRVVAAQPVVAVGQRRLEQRDPAALPLGQPVQPQPALGHLQRARRHVGADDLGVAPVPDQVAQQRPAAAAEVEHAGRAGLGERGQHRLAALRGQRLAAFGRGQLGLLVGGRRLGVVHRVGASSAVGCSSALVASARRCAR